MLSLIFGICLLILGVLGPFIFDASIGLGVFAALTHITPMQLHIESLRGPLLIACATLISYLFGTNFKKKFAVFPYELLLYLIMLIGMLIGAMNAYDNQLALGFFFTFCKYFIFLLMMVNILDSIQRIEIFNNFLIISAAWLVYKCWDLRGTTGARFENIDGGTVGDSNQFAAALILLIPLVLMRAFRGTNVAIRAGALLGTFGMLMSVIISVSRTGFLGLMALLLGFFIFFKSQRKRIATITFALVILVVPFLPEIYIDRVSTIINMKAEKRDDSSQSRLNSWGAAIDVWKKYPIYGCGVGNFKYYNGYLNEGKPWGEPGHVAHSLWFEILGEIGILGFIPFVGMIVTFFYRTQKAKRKLILNNEIYSDIAALQVGFIGFLVCASFVNRLIYEPIYWWFALAYVYDQRVISDKTINDN